MAEYQHFAAIFTTTLIREESRKVVLDPIKLEFFKGGARTFAIPTVTGRIFPAGMESTLLTTSSTLAFDPNSYYIAVIARSEEPQVRVALKACENAVDREITSLSLVYSPYIFDRQVYRGPVIEGNVISAGFYARRENPINFDSAQLKASLDAIRRVHSSSSDADMQERYSLMARFFAKAVPLDPSEEKFLFLWTVLEIFPMKDTTNIAPISDYLGHILGKSSSEVKDKLQIGRTFGLRSDLVHNGKLGLTPEELGKSIQMLEDICLEILRSISGQRYGGLLDKYFK